MRGDTPTQNRYFILESLLEENRGVSFPFNLSTFAQAESQSTLWSERVTDTRLQFRSSLFQRERDCSSSRGGSAIQKPRFVAGNPPFGKQEAGGSETTR